MQNKTTCHFDLCLWEIALTIGLVTSQLTVHVLNVQVVVQPCHRVPKWYETHEAMFAAHTRTRMGEDPVKAATNVSIVRCVMFCLRSAPAMSVCHGNTGYQTGMSKGIQGRRHYGWSMKVYRPTAQR